MKYHKSELTGYTFKCPKCSIIFRLENKDLANLKVTTISNKSRLRIPEIRTATIKCNCGCKVKIYTETYGNKQIHGRKIY